MALGFLSFSLSLSRSLSFFRVSLCLCVSLCVSLVLPSLSHTNSFSRWFSSSRFLNHTPRGRFKKDHPEREPTFSMFRRLCLCCGEEDDDSGEIRDADKGLFSNSRGCSNTPRRSANRTPKGREQDSSQAHLTSSPSREK